MRARRRSRDSVDSEWGAVLGRAVAQLLTDFGYR
jgi:hypothetical protein